MPAKVYPDILGDLHRSRRRAKYWSRVEVKARERRAKQFSRWAESHGMQLRVPTEAEKVEVLNAGYIGHIWGATTLLSALIRRKNYRKDGPTWLPKKWLSWEFRSEISRPSPAIL